MSTNTWTSRRRMEAALSFQEADRVPIEIQVPAHLRGYPKAERLVELVDTYSDGFGSIGGIDWSFCGVPAEQTKEELGKKDGRRRELVRWTTTAGNFEAILESDLFNPSYQHWEKHFIETPRDLERLASCDFPTPQVPDGYADQLEASCGTERTPIVYLPHPFGKLARMTPPAEFYAWLYSEADTIHKLFRKQYDQILSVVDNITAPCTHCFVALEMAIEPWLSRKMFDNFVYPYDKELNTRIHQHGGSVRHHVHGPVFHHLQHWADMGMDSIEPLEKPPAGNTDLAKAKKLMHGRMSLAGNLPSQFFIQMTLEEIERQTIEAIEAGAPGGGFILRCASVVAGLNSAKDNDQLDYMIKAIERFIDTGLKYGSY